MKYLDEIEADLQDNDEPLTLKSFSKKHGLSYKESSGILEEFLNQTQITVVCLYMLTGRRHNGEFLTTLTTRCKVDDVSKGLTSIKCYPYALMKSSKDAIVDLYYKNKDDLAQCTKSKHLPIIFNYEVALRNKAISPDVVKNFASPVKTSVPDEVDKLNISQSKDLANGKDSKSKASTLKSESKNEKRKKVLSKSDNALANLFAKQAVKEREQKTEESNIFPELSPKIHGHVEKSPDIPAKRVSKKRKQKHAKSSVSTCSKRKRIVAVSDTSSSEDETIENLDSDSENVEMPPVDGAQQSVASSNVENVSQVEARSESNRKCRKRTLVPKSYLGEDGFMETKWEYESEDIEEDEVAEEKQKPSPVKTKTEESRKPKPTVKDRKQASITSFFTKR